MIRRTLALRVLEMLVLAGFAIVVGSAADATALQPPDGRKIRVAVVLTDGAVVRRRATTESRTQAAPAFIRGMH